MIWSLEHNGIKTLLMLAFEPRKTHYPLSSKLFIRLKHSLHFTKRYAVCTFRRYLFDGLVETAIRKNTGKPVLSKHLWISQNVVA